MTPEERRIAQLEVQVRELTRRMEQIPRPVSSSVSVLLKTCTVIWGTEFLLPSGASSGRYGLKYKIGLATRTTVPAATPSTHLASTLDGVAWTTIGWVLVAPFTDAGGTFHAARTLSCPEGWPLLVLAAPVTMNNDAGGTSPVYVAYSL